MHNTTTFSLGGSCHEPPRTRPLALTFKQQEELREAKNWDALVDGAKQDVRNFCSNPYRWQELFTALLDAHRYDEALQVMNQMSVRGFPLPHAFLSRAGPAFLNSTEFKDSSMGAQYAARDAEIKDIMLRAERDLASMSKQDLPPNPYRSVGACPGQCCNHKRWKTDTAVQLRESIDSPKVVAEIPANVTVLALTGEVRGDPEPYVVLEDFGRLKAGDILFFLDDVGEWRVNFWYRGKLNPELGLPDEFSGLSLYTDEECYASDLKGACSLRRLQPQRKFLKQTWIRLRTSDGKEGWVLHSHQFSYVDKCG